jgi:hypothetical protein
MQRLRHGARQLLPVDATVATVADAALDRSAAARDGVSLCGEDGATALLAAAACTATLSPPAADSSSSST